MEARFLFKQPKATNVNVLKKFHTMTGITVKHVYCLSIGIRPLWHARAAQPKQYTVFKSTDALFALKVLLFGETGNVILVLQALNIVLRTKHALKAVSTF